MKAKARLLLTVTALLALPTFAAADEQKEKQLEQVVVTASRYEEPTEKVPASVTVITAEDIQATTAQTVPDVLRDKAGIEVRDILGNGRTATVGINGWGGETAGSNSLLLVDGRRVNKIDLSGIDWTQIPLDRIERIEVVRGGGAAVLYGDNAAGGVVNIITKKGVPGTHFNVGGGFGSYETHREEAGLSLGNDWVNLALTGNYSNSDGYRQNNSFRNSFGGGTLFLNPSEWVKVDVSGGAKSDRYGLPGFLLQSALDSGVSRRHTNFPDDDATTKEYYLQLTPYLDLKDGGTFRLGFLYDRSKARSNFTGQFFIDDKTIDTYGATPQYLRKDRFFGRQNNLTVGLDYYRYKLSQDSESFFSGFESTDDNHFRKDSLGYYADDTLELVPDLLYLSLGYRREQVAYDFNARHTDIAFGTETKLDQGLDEDLTAARAGLTLTYSPGSKLFVSYAKSFRTGAIDEYFSAFTSTVNTNLKPQRSEHYELGVQHAFAPWLTASALLFRVDTKDEIFLDAVTVDPVTGFALFANTNYHRTRREGVELSFNAPVKEWLALSGTYTYVNPELRSGAFESGNKIPGVATHMASGGVNLRFLENWRLDVRGRWMDEYYAISDWSNVGDKVDSWITVDTKITCQWKGLEAFAGVNNLFDEEYAEYVVFSNTLQELAFYPSPERNFLVGLRYAY
jgi:iron complex outermembrane receptor protein